ncbi:hypothetical protein CFOL_v3_08967 [Cephalotus follicularis]|uniref:Uncharacterized protein n=1 Tax=Cephalotus follicularis TaxID=3775 RepID=A0A1Q3BCB6_CEPFO|nr:hypothetical protein CFOL_v3_08967 [Cephalotus follicularis]
MAQSSFVLYLILAEAFIGLAITTEMGQAIVQEIAPSYSNPPVYQAEAPMIRKLGKQHPKMVKSLGAPSVSPSEEPQEMHSTEGAMENLSTVHGQDIILKKNHHSVDKSVAGGGVILGGLATTFLVAVFCYIKATATGRHNIKQGLTS